MRFSHSLLLRTFFPNVRLRALKNGRFNVRAKPSYNKRIFNTLQVKITMSVIAYIRVSTQVQPLESQEYEIRKWCEERSLSIDRWVTESVSGTKSWEKRMLGKTIRRMKPGDLLVCSEISRLGRNMLMIMSILNVCSQRRLRIHTIKDNFDLADNINSRIIDSRSPLLPRLKETSSHNGPVRPLQRKRPPA